jgi:PAS domain-containing protein
MTLMPDSSPHAGFPMPTTLHRLVTLAAALMNAPMAALMQMRPGRVDILVDHQVPAVAYGVELDLDAAGFSPDEPTIVCDALAHPYFCTYPVVKGAPFMRALIRLPVLSGAEPIALVLGYLEPISEPDPAKITALMELAGLAARELGIRPPGGTLEAATPEALQVIMARMDSNSLPVALLDDRLTYLHVNPPMATLNGRAIHDHPGLNIRDMDITSIDMLEAVLLTALREGRAFADIELIGERNGSDISVYSLNCRPSYPEGHKGAVLEVTIADVTSLRAAEDRLERGLGEMPQPALLSFDPTVKFLTQTLVERQSLRQRKGVSYLTLRSWRRPVRTYQIEALKALKTSPPSTLIDVAADDIVKALGRLVGASAFAQVVPVPCSRSPAHACLSVLIAEAVGLRIGKPVAHLLASAPQRGSSHPKENTRRPPLRLLTPASGPCLVVDDVATSGAHLEEAVSKLRPSAGSVFAVAWIGGDAEDGT